MKQQSEAKAKFKAAKPLHKARDDAGGIDIGANEIWVAVGPDRSEEPIRRFGAFTQDLLEIRDWLKQCAVRSVAMESTGLYWIGLYQIL